MSERERRTHRERGHSPTSKIITSGTPSSICRFWEQVKPTTLINAWKRLITFNPTTGHLTEAGETGDFVESEFEGSYIDDIEDVDQMFTASGQQEVTVWISQTGWRLTHMTLAMG